MIDDERPTPRMLEVQLEPRQRLRTPANGVPVFVPQEVSRRRRSDSDSDDTGAADALTEAIRSEVERYAKRQFRRVRALAWSALVSGLAAVLAVFGRMLDAREADGAQKQLLKFLESEVQILRAARERWRSEDQPVPWRFPFYPSTGASPVVPFDHAPRPAAPPPTPATKGPP